MPNEADFFEKLCHAKNRREEKKLEIELQRLKNFELSRAVEVFLEWGVPEGSVIMDSSALSNLIKAYDEYKGGG